MGLREDIALLQGLSIFDGLSEEYLRLLAFGAERRRLERGHVLFREGAAADCAFVVLSGQLTLTRDLPSGKDRDIGEAGPGPSYLDPGSGGPWSPRVGVSGLVSVMRRCFVRGVPGSRLATAGPAPAASRRCHGTIGDPSGACPPCPGASRGALDKPPQVRGVRVRSALCLHSGERAPP